MKSVQNAFIWVKCRYFLHLILPQAYQKKNAKGFYLLLFSIAHKKLLALGEILKIVLFSANMASIFYRYSLLLINCWVRRLFWSFIFCTFQKFHDFAVVEMYGIAINSITCYVTNVESCNIRSLPIKN